MMSIIYHTVADLEAELTEFKRALGIFYSDLQTMDSIHSQ